MKIDFIRMFDPGGSISNTSYSGNNFYDIYNPTVIKRWTEIFTDPTNSSLVNVEDINAFLKKQRELRVSTGYTGEYAKYGDGVQTYQQDYHNKYKFGNNKEFWDGRTYVSKTLNTGDRQNAEGTDFVGDNYYGLQTDNRRASYFNEAEVAKINAAIKSSGYKFVIDQDQPDNNSDGRAHYHVEKIENNTPVIPASNSTSTESTPIDNNVNDNTNDEEITPLEYLPQMREPKYTSWIDHLAQFVNSNSFANKFANLEKQKKYPKVLSPYYQAFLTSNYYTAQQLHNNAATLRDRSYKYALTNDLVGNMDNIAAADAKAAEIDNQATAVQAQGYQTSLPKVNQAAEKTLEAHTVGANQNNKIDSVAYNNRLSADQERIAKVTNAANKFIYNNNQDRSLHILNTNANRAMYADRVNEYLYAKEMHNIAKQREKLKDYQNSPEFKEAMSAIRNNHSTTVYFQNPEDYANDEKVAAKVAELWASDDPIIVPYKKKWKDRIDFVSAQLDTKEAEIQANHSKYNITQPARLSNQQKLNFKIPNYGGYITGGYKKGGTIKKGTSFLEYMKEIDNVEQNVRKQSIAANKQEDAVMMAQLKNISQEQLLLLRSIFK